MHFYLKLIFLSDRTSLITYFPQTQIDKLPRYVPDYDLQRARNVQNPKQTSTE